MPDDSTDELKRLQLELSEMKAQYHDFVYRVTHDLSGPFRQIEGFANIVLANHGEKFDDKSRRHLALIVSGSQKGKEILDALQDYSKLITDDCTITSVDCNLLIADIKTELSSIIALNGAQITYEGISTITGDYPKLYRLFYHLIHNALHYQLPENSPKIVIKSTKMKDHWQFIIQDNGIGFGQNISDKIFSALKRGVPDKKYAGIGMGLTIARSVVQQHGGQIWATSEQANGSTFNFTISKVQSSE